MSPEPAGAAHVLAIDEGTTRATVTLVDERGEVVAARSTELAQSFPQPGWVEQDAAAIPRLVVELAQAVLSDAGLVARDVAAIGITNQRETVVCWERTSGTPVAPAVVWQDRRGAEQCRRLEAAGVAPAISAATGLVLDPYFSATKIAWLLEHDTELARRAATGELCVGTVDTFLLAHLTGGGVFATEATNASRTLLFGLHSLTWEDELLDHFGIDAELLAEIRPSGSIFGAVAPGIEGLAGIPIAGVLGDQQSALFAQGCRAPGQAKNTYGTGSFVLANTGNAAAEERGGLLATVALGEEHGAQYALEGSIFATGAAIQWLRDGLGLIHEASESEALAASLEGNEDVWFVPALVGLGAPFWDPYARGTLLGVTRGTTRAHVVRAVLESIAWRTRDVLEEMARVGHEVTELRVDGGAAANAWLMQFQADVTGIPVDVAGVAETTSLGAAYLAGLTVGIWRDEAELDAHRTSGGRFEPRWSPARRAEQYARWREAVARSREWARPS